MKGFKRGEKGFTLVELLIVVAILGILAAVVIPNVVGLMGRGGKQAYETDLNTIQLAAATFFSDVHAGFLAGTWNNANQTAGHYYPTEKAHVTDHELVLSATEKDANGNPLVRIYEGAEALEGDISAHAIWMGLLVNYAGDGVGTGATLPERGTVAPLEDEDSLYLNQAPKSASASNGSAVPGAYTWVVGKNGVVYGVYPAQVDEGGTTVTRWFAGFSGSYP